MPSYQTATRPEYDVIVVVVMTTCYCLALIVWAEDLRTDVRLSVSSNIDTGTSTGKQHYSSDVA